MSSTKILMKPIKIGGVVIKNRIIMSGMTTGYANMDGSPSSKLKNHFVSRAKGGVGLLVMGAHAVSWPEGKICERMIAANNPNITSEYHDLADSVHAYGAKIIAQLHHGGFMAAPSIAGGKQSICASEFAGARAMTVEEIHRVRDDFIAAAINIRNCGLDGVQIHAANMYLLNQFMNPAINQRTDEYGGSLENRFRLTREIIEGIRAACPAPFILSIRLGAIDFFPGGSTLEDGIQYAKLAEEAGVDHIDVSCGFYTIPNQVMETQWEEEGSRLYLGEAIKKNVSIPVSVVGKLRTPEFCVSAIEEKKVDMVTLGRQLICDPEWANKVLFGKEETIRPCLYCCQGCAEQAFFNHGNIHCQINPYAGYEDKYCESSIPKVGVSKKIVVVGGGVAGMQFAITATRRGHDVTLIEKTDKLGGQMRLACVPPHKKEVSSALEWFRGEVNRAGVKVLYNTEATVESLKAMHANIVVFSTGATPVRPPIKGIKNAVESWDVLGGKSPVPQKKKVVIIGGGVVGSELAHMLCLNECDVTIIEMLPEICHGHNYAHKANLEGFLNEHATIQLNACVKEVGPDFVAFVDADGKSHTIQTDETISAAGHRPSGLDLYTEMINEGIESYKIGDCESVGNIRFATRSALELAYNI